MESIHCYINKTVSDEDDKATLSIFLESMLEGCKLQNLSTRTRVRMQMKMRMRGWWEVCMKHREL